MLKYKSYNFCRKLGKTKQFLFNAFLVTCSCSFIACYSEKKIVGTYGTNFAVMELYATKIILKPDNTFEYMVWGDLINDSLSGDYKTLDHKIFLSVFWKKTGEYRYTRSEMPVKVFKTAKDSARYQAFFFSRKDKFYFGDFETGKKITKAITYHRRKKFIFFGTHYFKKKWYLRRIE